jgi:hypothetical protein
MSTLKARLDSLASSFAAEVVRAIQSASLEELLAEVGGKRALGRKRGGALGVTGGMPGPLPGRAAAGKRGRLPRRSAEDIKATLDKVHGLLKASKGGLRAEQIRAALKLDVREMPRVLKEGLSTKKLSSKGQKRATTYFAR